MTHAKDELLRMHYKLGHTSFAKIRFMSTMGWVDTKLAKYEFPDEQDVYMARPRASHGGPKVFQTAY